MTSKHTPGPWQWSDAFTGYNGQPVWTLIGTGDGLYGILTCDQGNAPQDLNDEANARLIAAVPELHAAVAAVIDATRDYLPPDGITKDEFISRVIEATDNARMVEIMR